MKQLFVRDFWEMVRGTEVTGEFMVRNVQMCPQRNSDHYLSFELGDVTGFVKAKWWGRHERHCHNLQQIRYARVCGRVEEYQKRRIVIVHAVEDLGVPDDLTDFERNAPSAFSELTRCLEAHIASIRSPFLASLLLLIFEDRTVRGCFDDAPAVKSNHHAFRHGLLEQTVEVTDIAAAVADLQPTWGYTQAVEKDLVVAGALLHDIGKISELTWSGTEYDYMRRGLMFGYGTLGTQFLSSRIHKIPGFPMLLRDALLHAVLSHHGRNLALTK